MVVGTSLLDELPTHQGRMDDDHAAIERIGHAYERTRAAASARIELSTDHTWEMPPVPKRRRGGLMRPVTSAAKAAGKRLLRAAERRFDFRHQTAEGVIHLEERRYMLDYGSYARLYAAGKEWHGRSGRRLSRRRRRAPYLVGSRTCSPSRSRFASTTSMYDGSGFALSTARRRLSCGTSACRSTASIGAACPRSGHRGKLQRWPRPVSAVEARRDPRS